MIRFPDLCEGISAALGAEGHGRHGWTLRGGVIACRCGRIKFELAVIA